MEPVTLQPLVPSDATHRKAVTALWNRACSARFSIHPAFVSFNLRPCPGGVQEGRLALRDGLPVGFVLASGLPQAPSGMDPTLGWIDALAVDPTHQRQGIGTQLLTWAEEWLQAQGVQTVQVGGSLRPFVPGVPEEQETAIDFFVAQGYGTPPGLERVWDVARDLSGYTGVTGSRPVAAQIRPARPGEEESLLDFLAREFPGRWTYEAEMFFQDGGRVSDYMLLWTEKGIQGACRLTFEDSAWPLERFHPYGLPRPWGQLGSIGIAADQRGRGLGLALLDAGLRRLRDCGVRGCVIDWTTLLDFYARAGFQPYHTYRVLGRRL